MDLRSAIKSASKPKVKAVSFEGITGLFVRELTLRDLTTATEEAKDLRAAKAFSNVLCDADGKLVYDSSNDSHIQEILGMPFPLIDAINKAGDAGNVSPG
jgi:phosphoglucomutase